MDPLQPEFNNVVHHTKVDVFTSPYAQSASCFTTVVHHTKVGAFTNRTHRSRPFPAGVVHHTKVDIFTSHYAQSASCFTTVVHHTKVSAFTKSPHYVVDPLQPEFKTTSFTTQR